MEKNNVVFSIGLFLFIGYGIYSYISGVKDYINDSLTLSFTLLLVFFLRKVLKITPTSLSLLILAFVSHLSGVFGFYNKSPLPLQYDHFTHLIGLFAISILVFNAIKSYFSKSIFHNGIVLLFMFFCSLGIGAVVEQIEYIGYIRLGTGAGLFKFGGLGDTPFNEELLRPMDVIGGGWINTMLDLNYNFLGAIIGIILMYSINTYKLKKQGYLYGKPQVL